MESISLREFQLNASKYLGKEITLTRYNIPIATITPITVGNLKILEKKISEKIVEPVTREDRLDEWEAA